MLSLKKMGDYIKEARAKKFDTPQEQARVIDMCNYTAYTLGVNVEPFMDEYRKAFPAESKAFDAIESFQARYRIQHSIKIDTNDKNDNEVVHA